MNCSGLWHAENVQLKYPTCGQAQETGRVPCRGSAGESSLKSYRDAWIAKRWLFAC